jgi:hypothetical protein
VSVDRKQEGGVKTALFFNASAPLYLLAYAIDLQAILQLTPCANRSSLRFPCPQPNFGVASLGGRD